MLTRKVEADELLVLNNEIRLVYLAAFDREDRACGPIHRPLRQPPYRLPNRVAGKHSCVAGIETEVSVVLKTDGSRRCTFHERSELDWRGLDHRRTPGECSQGNHAKHHRNYPAGTIRGRFARESRFHAKGREFANRTPAIYPLTFQYRLRRLILDTTPPIGGKHARSVSGMRTSVPRFHLQSDWLQI